MVKNLRAADLLIDVGSTNIKWKTGGESAFRSTAFPLPFRSDPPYYEADGHEIYAVVKGLIDRERPKRVFLSVQMHGYVLLNGGKEVTGYVSWRDERAAALKPRFTLTEEYGVSLKPNLPRLSVQAQTAEADEFCTLGSYLVYKLTGNNVTHITDAAASGFYNAVRRTADHSVYRLPCARYTVEAAGTYGGCVVYTPVGDQQAAVLGALSPEAAGRLYLLNLGTAGQLCALSPAFVKGAFESRPYFGGGTLCTVTRLPGGAYLAAAGSCEDELFFAYTDALRRLPPRNGILVTGGAAVYHRALLQRVLERTGLPYSFCDRGEALNGLNLLAEETI